MMFKLKLTKLCTEENIEFANLLFKLTQGHVENVEDV